MTRTVLKHCRAYVDGYDMSGYTRSFGPLEVSFDESGITAVGDEVKNVLPGHARISMGTLNGIFDNTATVGIHAVLNAGTGKRTVLLPIGIGAEPSAGDPAFCGQFEQIGYLQEGDTMVAVSVPFGMTSAQADNKDYDRAWGRLLHAKGAETAANSATGGVDNGAATSLGGYFVYQVFSGDGTATLSVDDSADDSAYLALSGATSGELDMSSVQSGIVALGTTATVRQYLRWQLSLNTATTVTFAAAFIRG